MSKIENFKSLLFYQGLVSVKSADIDIRMQIPNETIKRIDIDYLLGALEVEQIFELKTDNLAQHLKNFALTGKLEVFEFLASEIKRNTGIRDYIYSEQCVKSMFLAYLSLTSYFVVKSELKLNKGFADIYLKPLNPYVKYVGLVEVKYFNRSTKGKRTKKPTVTEINAKVVEGYAQLKQYATDPEIIEWTTAKGKKLQKAVLVFYGWELIKYVAV